MNEISLFSVNQRMLMPISDIMCETTDFEVISLVFCANQQVN